MSAESVEPMKRTVGLYDELFARVLSGASTNEVVEAMVTGCAAVTEALVVDGSDCEVARAPLASTLDPRRDRWVLDVATQGRRTGRPVVVSRGDTTAIYYPTAVAGRYVGGILVLTPAGFGDGFIATIGRFAGLYALLAARDLALLRPGGGVDLPVVRDLLAHQGAVDADLRTRAERAGIDVTAEWVVGVVGPSPRADLRRMSDSAGARFDYVTVFGGAVAVMHEVGDSAGTAAEVAADIRRVVGFDALVCAASTNDGASGGLSRAHATAMEAVRVLRTAGRRCGAVDVASLPAYLPLLRSLTASEVDGFVDAQLGPLREFDGATSSELVRTLRVFFDENMNTAATARRLGLHPNTVIKRLRRVSELLGGEWADGSGAVSLRLALSIDGLAADPRG
ncbi:carbohydrate diacid transcriptional activator CdaR (plasmid) [Tsukamurella tyrosinosolvens]|uniref:PucR C-terminal helix-turn-helix domain-containing protein n=1 Tax=Tsukamurella tyrosinosolvens TaxID=57704 RepID=A0A1H4N787_TSUTY|nr:helix-turn-helix domain-containing protein [Tsukamurella tyrosinosolvens]KXO97055.1 hypothetical protein AXK58_07300 [Tsukamurella tyrosinosolvens]SEB91310.1 PucR C-terminal helix-turn-helix domain-containing protein [Tsukamurella tyrosinosolvens]VEI00385.1 carbohydrate diacid transcriptional activator CdaR [Tsukamurella tyrosinosolvens]